MKISVRGLCKNATLGSFKPSEATETKIEIEIFYIRIDIGGKNVVEIDKLNYKWIVDGMDYSAQVRSCLNI